MVKSEPCGTVCFLQVRVYQFSPAAKRTDCVVFDCLGGRENNKGLEIQVSRLPGQRGHSIVNAPGIVSTCTNLVKIGTVNTPPPPAPLT